MPPIKLKLSLGGATPKVEAVDPPALSRNNSYSNEENGGPGPSSLKLTLSVPGSSAQSAQASAAATPASTPGSGQPRKRRSTKSRPSAIPPHLATTPKTPAIALSPSAASTPGSDVNVKLEHFDDDPDPLSLPMSPSATATTPYYDNYGTPTREGSVETPTTRGKWKRVRRPFKELADKVLQEMRRKDEYGFFLEPVETEHYPDYLDIIGGEDKMMDLGTMQQKVDDGEYNSMDDLEADLKKMYDAAVTFNLPGTAPYREANKVYKHGMKHIDRARPLVLSPSPSPERQTSELPESQRSTPHPGRTRKMQVQHYIPVEMLPFPPNTSQAAAIGWNLTGGRRVRAKRFVRGREKFNGRWRDYCPDGSRDVAEMDDPHEILDIWREKRGDEWKTVPDWRALCEGETKWWEWDGPGGPTGQPPLPGAPRLQRDPLPTKELGTLDFGDYPMIEDEVAWLRRAPTGDLIPLEQQLRPDLPRPQRVPPGWPIQTFVNVHDSGVPAAEYLENMALGNVRGEAYVNSVQRFIDGALKGAEERSAACEVKAEEGEETGVDPAAALWDYASNQWHNGVLHSDVSRAAQRTMKALSEEAPEAVEKAKNAYARIALSKLTSPLNPLNIQPLLREPADFMYVGVGGKSGVKESLEWVGNEIVRVAKERQETKPEIRTQPQPKVEANGGIVMANCAPSNPNKRPAEESEQGDAKRIKVEGLPNGSAPATTSAADSSANAASSQSATSAVPQSVVVPPTTTATAPVVAPPTAPVLSTAPPIPINAPAAAPNVAPIPAPTAAPPAAATPGAATPAVPGPAVDDENGLRKLRLELVALTKFYPLACLRKMSKEDAARLLPANVRNLMTINPP